SGRNCTIFGSGVASAAETGASWPRKPRSPRLTTAPAAAACERKERRVAARNMANTSAKGEGGRAAIIENVGTEKPPPDQQTVVPLVSRLRYHAAPTGCLLVSHAMDRS